MFDIMTNDEVNEWFNGQSEVGKHLWNENLENAVKTLSNKIDKDILDYYMKKTKYINHIKLQKGYKLRGK